MHDSFEEDMLLRCEGNKTPTLETLIFLLKGARMGDEFAQVQRINYSHTLELIQTLARHLIDNSGRAEMRLMNNENRGYYFRVKKDSDLKKLVSSIQDDIIEITERGSYIIFSTSELSALNHDLRECP